MKRAVASLLSVLTFGLHPAPSVAQGGFATVPVATGLQVPVRLAFPPDGSGRMFILELQTGDVRIIEADTLRDAPWTHVDVSTGGERGLLGLAFDPGFATNGFVYLYYTAPGSPAVNRVVRLTDSGGVAAISTLMTLYEMRVATPCGTSLYHNAGALACPAPGELYISTGDNQCAQLSGSPDDPRGKILRIDPRIPAPDNAVASNAWYDDGDPSTGNDDRIFASGLRNPFGMTVSPIDSTVYVTENGPDCNDEIDRISNGNDYGWRPECDNGPLHCDCPQDSPWTGPIWSVTPTIAPTGIAVYRGTTLYPLPSGTLLFTSYNDGVVRKGVSAGPDSLDVSVFADPGLGSLLDIVFGPDSLLYFTSTQGIYRYEPVGNGVSERARGTGPGRIVVSFPAGEETAALRYDLPGPGTVTLEIFDVAGRLVLRRADRAASAGPRNDRFRTAGLAAGAYFVRVVTPDVALATHLFIIR